MNEIREKQDFSVLIYQDSKSRVKQVKLVLLIFASVLLLLVINNTIYYESFWSVELSVAILTLLLLYSFVTSDTTNIVAGMLLWTATILASYVAWKEDGLYDTAIMTFPCILIFASLLGGRVLMFPLIAYMLSVFYFFAYADSTGFAQFTINSKISLWAKANNLSIILIIFGSGIGLTSTYVKRLINQLYSKQERNEIIQKKADELILFDHLTRLPNEELCEQHLQQFIENSRGSDEIIGFLTLDLDNFKWVNSSLGHDVGDRTLCYLAERLKKLTNDKSGLYRSAGKEFILLVQAIDYEEISEFSHQILQTIHRPFQIESYDIEISCSMGISISPFDGSSFQQLRQKSHTALSRAKESEDTNTFKFFEIEMEEFVHNRLKMVQDLKKAIELDEFKLFYQPKVNLETNETEGAEALIRWFKGGTKIVSPVEFIPVTEESGLINEIGKWTLEKACSDCRLWHDKGMNKMTVAVNLSPVQFRRGNLPNIVFRALAKSNLDPSFLELEITESLFIEDTEHVKEQLYQIASKGISIAIDDFGTGYSNLNYLTKFNASTLKIDMSFVSNMMTSEQQRHIVNAIIKMSNTMALKNVAEGVEDVETVNQLKDFGCQYGQGYYWSKPLPNQEFMQMLKL